MSPLVTWGLILAVAAGTFAIRVFPFVLFDRVEAVPAWVERVLGHVPTAVLSAMIVPAVLLVDGSVAVSLDNARLVASVVAVAVAAYTESIPATLVGGMATLWLMAFVTA